MLHRQPFFESYIWRNLLKMDVLQLKEILTPRPTLARVFHQFALEFVSLSENGVLCAVSKEFREAAEGDALWRQAYNSRFPKKSEVCDSVGQGGPDASAGGCSGGTRGDDDDNDDDDAGTTAPSSGESGAQQSAGVKASGFKHRYKRRLEDPHVSKVWLVKRVMRREHSIDENVGSDELVSSCHIMPT